MSNYKNSTKSAKSSMPKKSAKEKLIDAIVDGINKTQSLPWDNGRLNGDMSPINRISKKKYHGVNRIMLYFFSRTMTAPSKEYVTFLQAKKAGGNVKKGAKGCPIIFFSFWDTARKCPKDEESDPKDVVPLTKCSTVFDISQCDGIKPSREVKSINHPPMTDVDKMVQTFADKTNLKLDLSGVGGVGCYMPLKHAVSVAGLKYHKTAAAFYSTLFHELIHSTGKAMGRKVENFFGSHEYSEEEIVAETGAMLLCLEFGIEKVEKDNSIAYLKSWGSRLKENPNWLIKGVGDAEKAVKYFFDTVGYTPKVI